MGRKSVFPKPQHDWITARIPEYVSKTAFGKPLIPGQPPAIDDADLSQWVRQCRDQFEVQFKSELDTESNNTVLAATATMSTSSGETFMESIRQKFDRKFINAKACAKAKFEKEQLKVLSSSSNAIHHPQSPSNSAPTALSTIIKATPITGRRLFEQFLSNTINKHVQAARLEASVGREKHAAMYQTELKRRWDLLSDKEKKEYNARAVELNEGDGQQIYRNQEVFVGDLTSMLCDLIGNENHQIGNASVHLLYGYRDVHGTLKTGSVAVRADPNDVAFDASDPNYNEYTMTPWSKYCQEHILRNETGHDVTIPTSGPPIFPTLNEDEPMTIQGLRVVLQGFIEAQWAYARSLTPGEPMQWDDITGLLSTYVTVELSPSLQTLDNPARMPAEAIFNVIGFIKSHQAQHGPFSLFLSSPSSPPAMPVPVVDLQSLDDFSVPPSTPRLHVAMPLSASEPMGKTDPAGFGHETRKKITDPLAPNGAHSVIPQAQPEILPHTTQPMPTSLCPSVSDGVLDPLLAAAIYSTPPSPCSSPPPVIRDAPMIDTNPESPGLIVPTAQTLKVPPSGTKRKSETSIQPEEPAKRVKGSAASNTNPRRSTRKKASHLDAKAPDTSKSNILPSSIAGLSRTGKPLKNSKNWVYVPRE